MSIVLVDRKYMDDMVLSFFGGECTLHIDLINKIVDYFIAGCIKNNISDWLDNYKIDIATNGTTYFSSKVHEFYNKYKQHLILSLTIDGGKACHDLCRKYVNGKGTYDDVAAAVVDSRNLINTDPNTKLTFSLENMSYIKQSIISLIDLGYTAVNASFDILATLDKTQSDKYFEYLKEAIDYIIDNKIKFLLSLPPIMIFSRSDFNNIENGFIKLPECGCMGSQLALDYNSDIYYCQHLNNSFLPNSKGTMVIGHVDTKTNVIKLDIENIMAMRNRKVSIEQPECIGCPLTPTCNICPAYNILFNNNIDITRRQCGVTVAEAKASIYFAKRAKETDYPYFRNYVDSVLNKLKYDPDRKYLIDKK